jgi:hypothetical protein
LKRLRGERLRFAYILGEVTSLVALVTLHAFCRARFWAFLRGVTILLTVLASIPINTLFGAVTRTMAVCLAVEAMDLTLGVLAFD